MSTRIAVHLWEFAWQTRAAAPGTLDAPGDNRPARAAVAALALLPFRRLFKGARVSSRIKDFVYTLS